MANPLLKFPGGKRRLAPFIDTFRPEGWPVAEPFAGAAAYTLYALEHGAPSATVSDVDPRVMMIHQALADKRFPTEWARRAPIPADKAGYLRLREQVNRALGQQTFLLPAPDLAVLLIQLARSAFNGLWRTNRKGEFNAPSGTFPAFEPSDQEVARVCELYARIRVAHARHFEDADVSQSGQSTYVYCDPPYLGTPFTGYGNGKAFTVEDHERLARWAEAQRAHGHVAVVSNQCNVSTRRTLYPRAAGWKIHEVTTRRSIGACTGGATRVGEFLAVLGGAR